MQSWFFPDASVVRLPVELRRVGLGFRGGGGGGRCVGVCVVGVACTQAMPMTACLKIGSAVMQSRGLEGGECSAGVCVWHTLSHVADQGTSAPSKE